MTRREMLCYAAGFFDGEGSINLYWVGNLNKIPGVRITVYNTQELPLQIFIDLFGGKIRKQKKPRLPGRKLVHSWGEPSRPKLVQILKELLPFIREPDKRIRIEYFLAKQHLLDRSGYRAKPLSKIQTQNRIDFIRNWPNLNSKTLEKLVLVGASDCK